jgi:hypothetical protein
VSKSLCRTHLSAFFGPTATVWRLLRLGMDRPPSTPLTRANVSLTIHFFVASPPPLAPSRRQLTSSPVLFHITVSIRVTKSTSNPQRNQSVDSIWYLARPTADNNHYTGIRNQASTFNQCHLISVRKTDSALTILYGQCCISPSSSA